MRVWHDLRNGLDYDVYGEIDGQEILIAGGPHNQVMPTVLAQSDGSHLVAWADFADGQRYRIRFATVAPDGTVVVDPRAVASPSGRHALGPVLVAADGPWLFWSSVDGYRAQVVGCPIADPRPFVLDPALRSANPTVTATDGRRLLLVWLHVQGKGQRTHNDAIGLLFDTVARRLITPVPGTAIPFVRIGSGTMAEVLWIEDGSNGARPGPKPWIVRDLFATDIGGIAWVLWVADYRGTARGNNQVSMLFEIRARRVDLATGAYLDGTGLGLLLASGTSPSWRPRLEVVDPDLVCRYEEEDPEGQPQPRQVPVLV